MGGFVALVLAIAAAKLLIRPERVADIRICEPDLVFHVVGQPFDSTTWKEVPDARLAMLESLARTQRFRGTEPALIEEMLGPSECYVGYDNEPCYRVPVLGSEDRYLAFMVAHSGSDWGKVLGAELDVDPFPAWSCS